MKDLDIHLIQHIMDDEKVSGQLRNGSRCTPNPIWMFCSRW